MRLRPFFSYYGSKFRLAPRYPKPEYPKLVEPFAGSAAYSCLHHQRRVELYDNNPEVAALWRYLIRVNGSEIRRIPDLGPEESIDDLVGVPEEARLLVGFWLNKGTAHLCRRAGGWMRTGKYANQFWGPVIRERVAAQVDHIRHWRVGGEDYRQAGHEEATHFVDPPYQGPKGRYYYGRNIDYEALAHWCRSLRGQVMVCETSGATWLPFKEFATTRGTAVDRSQETLWTNQPSAPQQLALWGEVRARAA